MKKYEALYDWPISEVRRLADSNLAENFSGTLGGPTLDAFTSLTEQMRGLGADLGQAKAARTHFDNWGSLDRLLRTFEEQFSSFPDPAFRKFRLFVLIAEKLAQDTPPLDGIDIDETQFEIRGISDVPVTWYVRENGRSFSDSVGLFTFRNMAAIELELSGANLSPAFSFHFLAALSIVPNEPAGHLAFVKKNMPQVETPAIDAFARLVLLASGKSVHVPKRHVSAPSVIDADCICVGHPYQQWKEVLDVLSEYNGREEILLKYLTIYHVIENLMFKFPIVELERQHGGKMFSIRDFRRLYRQVEASELVALKKLFSVVFAGNVAPGVNFDAHLVARWQALAVTTPVVDISRALAQLGIQRGQRPMQHTDLVVDAEAAGLFAQVVYAVRCAIVHNKETEFHLTYATLDDVFVSLLVAFLLPSLEEICFSLIGEPNQNVWYVNKQLMLYQ